MVKKETSGNKEIGSNTEMDNVEGKTEETWCFEKSLAPEIYFPALRSTLPTLGQPAGIDPSRLKE